MNAMGCLFTRSSAGTLVGTRVYLNGLDAGIPGTYVITGTTPAASPSRIAGTRVWTAVALAEAR